MKIKTLIDYIESLAHPALQESYDNSGWQTGNPGEDIKAILICLDITEEVIDEAIENKCNLLISHHPLIFKGIKQIAGQNMTVRCIEKAIRNHINIYSIHTNLDNIMQGVSFGIAEKLNLSKLKVLRPLPNQLKKLVTFVPVNYADTVRSAMFEAGAGHIGNYDSCSFNLSGKGTFKAGNQAKPFVGKINEEHHEPEIRIETIIPSYLQSHVIKALLEHHPYEEVAYDIYPLENINPQMGSGLIGVLEKPLDAIALLKLMKERINTNCIRHSKLSDQRIRKVALCGGAGSFLLKDAIHQKADIFISADFKYHDFFEAGNQLVIADIGHYESEQFVLSFLQEFISRKFRTFAVRLTSINSNPVNYF